MTQSLTTNKNHNMLHFTYIIVIINNNNESYGLLHFVTYSLLLTPWYLIYR